MVIETRRRNQPLDPTSVTVGSWGKNQGTSSSSEDDADENSWDNQYSVLSTLGKEKQQHPLASKFPLKVAMTVHDARMLDQRNSEISK